jgi:hypothetical protein
MKQEASSTNVMKNNRPAYGQVLIRFLPNSDIILTAFQLRNRILNLGIGDPDTTR